MEFPDYPPINSSRCFQTKSCADDSIIYSKQFGVSITTSTKQGKRGGRGHAHVQLLEYWMVLLHVAMQLPTYSPYSKRLKKQVYFMLQCHCQRIIYIKLHCSEKDHFSSMKMHTLASMDKMFPLVY